MTDRRYGNWLRPGRLSVRGVGMPAALFVAGSWFVGLVVMQYQLPVGVMILASGPAVAVLAGARLGGATVPEYLRRRARRLWAERTGATRHLAPAPVGAGGWQLPEPLDRTRMVTLGPPGGVWGAVLDPATRRIAVTLTVAASPLELTDPPEVDAAVARWERWLEGLGRRPEVAYVNVTVETGPDPARPVAQMIAARLAADAPADCRTLLHALARSEPATASRTDTRVTIVFDLRAFAGRAGTTAGYTPALSAALAGLEAGLDGCGVSVLGRATPGELAATVLAAVDPARAGQVAGVLAAAPADPPRWEFAGPAGAQELRDAYRHDSGTSVSFVWAQAPRHPVTSAVLGPLTRPGRFRKRVTLTYVATPSGDALTAATAQVRRGLLTRAVAQIPVLGRPVTADDDRDVLAAQQSTHEVAAGAGWLATTVLVTTTVLDEADLPAAIGELEHAAGASQLRLRRLYDLQAAGFYAGLPAGLHLPELARGWPR